MLALNLLSLIVLIHISQHATNNFTSVKKDSLMWELSVPDDSVNLSSYSIYSLFNNDSSNCEIIVCGQPVIEGMRKLTVIKISNKGDVIWHRTLDFVSSPPFSLSVYSSNLRDKTKIAIVGGYEASFVVFGYETGDIIVDRSQETSLVGYKPANQIVDYNNDGIPEIILVDAIGNIRCFGLNKLLWEKSVYTRSELMYIDAFDYRFPAIAPKIYDLESDGKPEVIVCFGQGFPHIFCFDATNGNIKWKHESEHTNLKFTSSPLILDCNRDSIFEIIVATGGPFLFQDSVYIFSLDATNGNQLWHIYLTNGFTPFVSQFMIGNSTFLLLTFWNSDKIYVIEGNTGQVVYECNLPFCIENIFINDINKNYLPEIYFDAMDNYVYAYEVETPDNINVKAEIKLYNKIQGDSINRLMSGISLLDLQPIWRYHCLGNDLLVNDIDSDSLPEMVMIRDGKICAIKIIPRQKD